MGENIADFAGIQVALDAYHRSLNGKPAPVIDGLTGDQRFFLAYAQVWREKQREDALRSQVTSDPHSPGRFRVLGPIRNVDAWYEAFGITPGSSNVHPAGEARAHLVSIDRCERGGELLSGGSPFLPQPRPVIGPARGGAKSRGATDAPGEPAVT